jgi:hypothetical protein
MRIIEVVEVEIFVFVGVVVGGIEEPVGIVPVAEEVVV